MRIHHAEIAHYRGASPGARAGTRPASEREGLLLRLTANDGLVGQGEASPLPGYCRDTLADARAALDGVEWSALPDFEAGGPVHGLLAALAAQVPSSSAAARFACEAALLDLAGQRTGVPMWALLDPRATARGAVPLSSFVGSARDERAVSRALAAVERGVRTIKVKVEGPDLRDQLPVLADIRRAIGERALRLDANGSLAPATARAELDRLSGLEPEFIEEPVQPAALETLEASPIPIALDESLQDPAAFARLEPRFESLRVRAVVLKPMALGGVTACLALAATARARGLETVLSHLFDGPVALAATAHLALALASRSLASGLERHAGLAAWPSLAVPFVSDTAVNAVSGVRGLGVPSLPGPS